MAFKEPGGSLPPLYKLAIGPYLQQDLSILQDHNSTYDYKNKILRNIKESFEMWWGE